MDTIEKKQIALNFECESFKPKGEIKLDHSKPEVGLKLSEESERLIKTKDTSIRKSSSDSTSVSKIDDLSEIANLPLENVNCSQELFQNKGNFFGRDKNCSNEIFNFYQNTVEYFQDIYPEFKKYKTSKNYKSKNDYYKEISEYKPYKNKSVSANENINGNLNSSLNNTSTNFNDMSNLNYTNPLKTTSVAAVMGTYAPNIKNLCSGVDGKFDMPMYCVGFYGWDAINSMKNAQDKDKKNDSEKKIENIQPKFMLTTPIFFNNISTCYYNKLYKKKYKPFVEREGDWICNNCKNLNFAFRMECNRCKCPKNDDSKTDKDEIKKEINKEQKPHYQYNKRYNYNNCKYKKNYNYYQKTNEENK